MAKKKVSYTANDGSEHTTAEEAESRDSLMEAEKQLEKAIFAVEKALGERARTADGLALDMSKWNHLWSVRDCWGQVPHVVEVSAYPYYTSIGFNESQPEVLMLRITKGGREFEEIEINKVYAEQSNAEAAALALMEQRTTEYLEDVKKAKERIKTRSDFRFR